MNHKIAEPKTAEDWEMYYELRWKVLRAPWDQPKGSEKEASDASAVNLMILGEDQRPIAVGRVHLEERGLAQVRFVAVEESMQGKGVGRLLMQELEQRARNLGASKVFLQSRENALEFYRRLGYTVTEKTALLFGVIQHYRMEKDL